MDSRLDEEADISLSLPFSDSLLLRSHVATFVAKGLTNPADIEAARLSVATGPGGKPKSAALTHMRRYYEQLASDRCVLGWAGRGQLDLSGLRVAAIPPGRLPIL